MLKNVLKYDLKSVLKVLVIFYSLALFFGSLTRIFLNVNDSFILNIIGQVCSGVTIAMLFNIIINNLMRLWVRFKSNLYADESYLTHTLPVEKKTLYLSKFITTIITLFISMLVIALTLFIAYYSKDNMELVKKVLLPVANSYHVSLVKVLLAFLFVLFLELANAVQAGYMGIILGHKMNNAKMAFSVLFGFGAYVMTQILAVASLFVVALFNKDIMNLFFTNDITNINIIKTIICLAIIIYIITLMLGYFINLHVFKKGVNVD